MSVSLTLTEEQVTLLRELVAQLPEPEATEAPEKTQEEQVAEEFGIELSGTKANQEKQLKAGLAKHLTELGGKPGVKPWGKLLEEIRKLQPADETETTEDGAEEAPAEDAEEDKEGDECVVNIKTGPTKGCYVVRLEGGKKKAYHATPNPDDDADATINMDPVTGEEDYAGEFDGKKIILAPKKPATKAAPAKSAAAAAAAAAVKAAPAKTSAAKPAAAKSTKSAAKK